MNMNDDVNNVIGNEIGTETLETAECCGECRYLKPCPAVLA